jgi:hypothetical protein
MPAPIVTGVINYIQTQLSLEVWFGEIPREDGSGNIITIDIPNTTVFRVPGFDSQSDWQFGNTYSDNGKIVVELYATSFVTLEAAMTDVDNLLVDSSNWPSIIPNGPDPFSVFAFIRSGWNQKQLENVRSRASNLVFQGMLNYDVGIHGVATTR